jgi:hypothetical protein
MPPLHWHDLRFRPGPPTCRFAWPIARPFGLFLPAGCCPLFFVLRSVHGPFMSTGYYRPAAVRRGSVRHLGYIRPWGAAPCVISVLSVCLPAMARPGPLRRCDPQISHKKIFRLSLHLGLSPAFFYGWIPHNAGFGFLDLAPSILHSNWFWDYIS